MRKHTKLLLAALTAVVALAVVAGSASANRSIQVRGGERGVQAESRLTFSGTNGESQIVCDVTLRRTIATSIPKVSGTLFGKVTGIRIDRGGTTRSPHCRTQIGEETHDIVPLNCTHSEDGRGFLTYDCTRAPAALWKLIYDSFQGTLPRIEGINFHIQGVQFALFILVFGATVECLYEGSGFGLIRVTAEGTITRAEAIRARTNLRKIRERGFGCPSAGSFSGEFNVRPTLTIALV